MRYIRETKTFIIKELYTEWRFKASLNGLLLYILSTVFISYLCFHLKTRAVAPPVWNALFWIIIFFTSLNTIAKSFIQERNARLLYYHHLLHPLSLILAKIIYNTLLLIALNFIAFFFYSLILGNPVEDLLLFSINLILGAFGFSATLTLISAISAKASQNMVLMAVLSFPLIVPQILLLIKTAFNAIDGLAMSVSMDEVISLTALNFMITGLSCILFPFLWRS